MSKEIILDNDVGCIDDINCLDDCEESITTLSSCDEEITPFEEYVTTSTGTNNYEELSNLPSINNVTLIKNKTSKELKLQDEMSALTNMDIQRLVGGN